MASWDDGAILGELIAALRQRGYATSVKILDAFRHGVPQHRARLFLVGTRGTVQFAWPRNLARIPTLRDAIGDLPRARPAQRKILLPYSGPKTPLQRRLRRGVARSDATLIHDHVTRDVRPDDREAFALLKPGQTYRDLPKRLRRYRADIFDDKYKRLRWNELCRTITAHIAKDGYWYIHPSQHRTLSIREAARIQTFPDWFRFAGYPSDQYRQIGNAVPPILAERIADAVAAVLSKGMCRGPDVATEFRSRIDRWHRAQGRDHAFAWRTTPAHAWSAVVGEVALARLPHEEASQAFKELMRFGRTPATFLRNQAAVRRWAKERAMEGRVRRLLLIAGAIARLSDAKVPSTVEELKKLPTVGDYLASAIRTFGFGRSAILVDQVTERVVKRFTGLRELPRWQLRVELLQLAGSAGPDRNFNAALLELGSTVCTRRKPRCNECPMLDLCLTNGRTGASNGPVGRAVPRIASRMRV